MAMMKQLALIILTGLLTLKASGQAETVAVVEQAEKKKEKRRQPPDPGPSIYITTSTGLNNNTGITGGNIEIPVHPKVTVDAGFGAGTWNHKLFAGAKYYLKPAQRGFAFGGGASYASGTRGKTYTMTDIYGNTSEERINKNPQINAFFAAYKYWTIGKNYHRIYAQLGWSVPVGNGPRITQLTGNPISAVSRDEMGASAPGGPIVAAGFSFGIP